MFCGKPDAVWGGESGRSSDGVLDGVVSVEGKWAVLGVNLGRPIVTNVDFVVYLCKSDALFPNYLERTCYDSFAKITSVLRSVHIIHLISPHLI